MARSNAERLAPGRVALVRGDLLAAFGPGLDLIAANLPYVTSQEWTALADGVKSYAPALALDGGTDGLDAVSYAHLDVYKRQIYSIFRHLHQFQFY